MVEKLKDELADLAIEVKVINQTNKEQNQIITLNQDELNKEKEEVKRLTEVYQTLCSDKKNLENELQKKENAHNEL